MEIEIGFLNRSYSAEKEFMVYQTSGDIRELPDRIKEELTVAEAEELESGEWIMLVDGTIEQVSHHHPFLIHAEE